MLNEEKTVFLSKLSMLRIMNTRRKIVDKDAILEKAFLGSNQFIIQILTFGLSRRYDISFIIDDDHESSINNMANRQLLMKLLENRVASWFMSVHQHSARLSKDC